MKLIQYVILFLLLLCITGRLRKNPEKIRNAMLAVAEEMHNTLTGDVQTSCYESCERMMKRICTDASQYIDRASNYAKLNVGNYMNTWDKSNGEQKRAEISTSINLDLDKELQKIIT